MHIEIPKRTKPEKCTQCTTGEVWCTTVGVCDKCFRVAWHVFAVAMGWEDDNVTVNSPTWGEQIQNRLTGNK